MKKMFAVLLALVLGMTACCFAAAAEDDSVPPSTPEMKAFESKWVSEDGQTMVWLSRQDDGFQIQAARVTGENTFTAWEYLAGFDPETKSLTNVEGIRGDYRLTEEAEEFIEGTSIDEIKADFILEEDGRLTWKDEQEGTETHLRKTGEFAGRYLCDRAAIDFAWNAHENDYAIVVSWGQNAWQTWDYQLKGTYDPGTETVVFKGLKQLLTYDDNGELDATADTEEAELEGTFTFNDAGGLVWQSTDGSGDGIVFESDSIPLWDILFER